MLQVQCASLSRPKPNEKDPNDVEVSESSDHLEEHRRDSQESQNTVPSKSDAEFNLDDPGKPPDSLLNTPTSDSMKTNSHTITSQDFAEKTGVVGPQVVGSKNPEPPDVHQPDSPVDPGPDKGHPTKNNEANPIDHTNGDADNTNTINNKQNSDVKTSKGETNSADVPSETDNITPNNQDAQKNSLSLEELAQYISEEIKVYCNEVAMNWEGKKGGASWTLEADSVLKDYMDKISIAQSANNSNCVKKDLDNHAARSKSLQDVVDSCRSELKREQWCKLQEKTKNTLNQISDIVHEASKSVGKLSKNDPNYITEKINIKNRAKQKLQDLYSVNLKNKFTKLRDSTMEADENEYATCVDSKPEKGMIVDTLNDIMRIKNNCVG